jgi:hypothetical protein
MEIISRIKIANIFSLSIVINYKAKLVCVSSSHAIYGLRLVAFISS